MNAGYITSTFTTIEDLAKLQSETDELNTLLLAIKQLAHGSRTPSPSLLDDAALNTALDEVAAVANIVSNAPDVDLLKSSAIFDAVQSLINAHTKIEPFAELLRALQTKKQALIDTQAVSVAQELLNRLETVDMSPETDDILLAVSRDAPAADTLSVVSQQCVSAVEAAINEKVNLKRRVLESDLSSSLKAISWLSPDFDVTTITQTTRSNIRSSFDRLLTVQASSKLIPQYPDTWWAVQILLAPAIARFNYHFASANNKTNKSSKPEWALEFTESFLAENMSSILWLVGDSLTKWQYVAEYEIITAILAPLRVKFLAEIKSINSLIARDSTSEKSGRLLSHLVYEVAAFDLRIKSRYMFDPWYRIPTGDETTAIAEKDKSGMGSAYANLDGSTWCGLNSELLLDQDDEGVINWLNFERELARKRFETEILGAADAFAIDLDFQENYETDSPILSQLSGAVMGASHPTYSAYSLAKLFGNLTSHFQAVGSVKYQLKYLSSIQLKLLEDYYDKLLSLQRRYNDTHYTAAMISLIPGALHVKEKLGDQEDTKTGLEAIEMLTGIYCLARFISNKLQEWSMELIFVQLFEFYRKNVDETDAAQSLFDDDMQKYSELASSAMNLIQTFFRTQVKSTLKPYVNLSVWDGEFDHEQEPSKQLGPLINLVTVFIVPLRRAVSTAEYIAVSSGILSSICRIILEYVITNNRFSEAGIAQLQADINFVFSELATPLLMENPESLNSTRTNPTFKQLIQLVGVLKFFSQRQHSDEERQSFLSSQDALSASQIEDLQLRVTF